MSRDELLRGMERAYEQVIAAATDAARRGVTDTGYGWGPREIVAHLAGWETMATVRVPRIAAGMAPLEFADEERQAVMTDAINATIIAMIGEQSLDAVCGILRQAYQRELVLLRSLDEKVFQPGEYVYERTKAAAEHCHEHMEQLASAAGQAR